MSEDDDDDARVRALIIRRSLKAAACFGFFVLALLGLYAEVALTSYVVDTLGISHSGGGGLHFVVFCGYVIAVFLAAWQLSEG